MPRGRHPEAEHPLSNAERQARYRARREAHEAAPVVRYRRPADRRTRSQRWLDPVAGLLALQAEYAAWYDALPDSLRDTPTAAALRPSSIWISMNSPPSCRRGGTDAIDRPGASNLHPQLSGKICRAALAPLDEHQGKMRRDNRQWQTPTVTACRSPAPAQASASGCS